jgi:hypothetical protein
MKLVHLIRHQSPLSTKAQFNRWNPLCLWLMNPCHRHPAPIMQPTQTKNALPAELGGGGDLIVFASSRTGSTQLWTLHPDGSELTQFD